MSHARSNRRIDAALRYHQATNHSEERLRADRHFLDWANQPRPFKVYRGLDSIPLPADADTVLGSTPAALEALAVSTVDEQPATGQERVPTLALLARVLYLSAGITKRRRYAGGEMYFRAYANTGALYHIDLYVVSTDLPDLPAGVYHFGPHDFALHRLRSGDFRSVLVEASGGQARIARAPVVLVSASTYWRNAWKYRARTYRHCFWDAGTLHANLLAIAATESLHPMVVLGFVDATVERLLGLDRAREGALTLVPLGAGARPPPASVAVDELALDVEPLSRSEVDYPLIREMHAASSLDRNSDATAWRGGMADPQPGPATGTVVPLATREETEPPAASLADVIRKRGSTRAFDRSRSISYQALSTLLDRATRGLAADVFQGPGATMIEHYLIVNAVHGLAPGSYYFRRTERSLELLREGSFRAAAGRLDLGQDLAADAAVNLYSLCSLPDVLERFGNRGYRAAQLEGGITAGRMYIAAYAQGFGATGLTFFDDEVVEFFSPHAAGKSVMFLVAVGYPDRAALGHAPT